MKNYYGEKSSFFAKVITIFSIIISFINTLNFWSANQWIMGFEVLTSGLILASIILLLESILYNVAKSIEKK